eukprot:12557-Pleurochrysis_carterae.AAC.1
MPAAKAAHNNKCGAISQVRPHLISDEPRGQPTAEVNPHRIEREKARKGNWGEWPGDGGV